MRLSLAITTLLSVATAAAALGNETSPGSLRGKKKSSSLSSNSLSKTKHSAADRHTPFNSTKMSSPLAVASEPWADDRPSKSKSKPKPERLAGSIVNKKQVKKGNSSRHLSSQCIDTPEWVDSYGDGCEWYETNDEPGCPEDGADWDGGMGVANDNCCHCKESSSTCPNKSFLSKAELQSAVDAYISQGCSTNSNCAIGVEYGYPIGSWCVGGVTDMSDLFRFKSNFNEPIGDWDTGSVTDMSFMFKEASSFNQAIGTWDTSLVTNMDSMFHEAGSFNQNLCSWSKTFPYGSAWWLFDKSGCTFTDTPNEASSPFCASDCNSGTTCYCLWHIESVCGANGHTYSNNCWAGCESVSIEHSGECCAEGMEWDANADTCVCPDGTTEQDGSCVTPSNPANCWEDGTVCATCNNCCNSWSWKWDVFFTTCGV